jgi:hypothetical protein
MAAFVAVPLALGLIEFFAEDEHLRFLLFPSVGAIAYKLFTTPVGSHATWRGGVIAPTVGAAIGTLGPTRSHLDSWGWRSSRP